MDKDLEYKIVEPDESLADFVDSFWFLCNKSGSDKRTIGLPDGRVDLMLFKSDAEPFQIKLIGVGTRQHEQGLIAARSLRFAVSFKLLAVEYILRETIAGIVNYGKLLPVDFWDFSAADLEDFDAFCEKSSRKIRTILPAEIDNRKRKLFELIYSSKGELTVKELSEKSFWSSRQINRYFNQQFGISLKAYCNVIRFRASLDHLAKGKLFPEQDFTDQNHFIKDVKKFSGVTPKELSRNQNDRFILLSTLA